MTVNALWIVIADALKAVTGFVTLLIIVNLGGISTYGTYRAIISLSSLLMIFTDLGIQTALLKYLRESEAYMTAALLLRTSLSTVIFLLIYLAGLPIPIKLDREFLIAASLFTFFNVSSIFRAYYTAKLSFKTFLNGLVLGYVTMLSLTTLTLLAGWGVKGLLIAYAASNALNIAYQLFKAISMGYRPIEPKLLHIRSLITLGASTWVPSIFRVLGRYSAELFIFAYAGAIQTGKYSVAFTLLTFTTMVLNPVAQLLIPNLDRYPEDQRNKVLSDVLTVNYAILMPIAGSLALASDYVMKLLGAEEGILLKVLLISTLFVPLMKANTIMMVRREEKGLIAGRGILINSIKLALFYLLTPIYGGLGAALSYTVGEMMRGPIEVYLLFKHGLKVRWRKVLLLMAVFITPLLLSFRYVDFLTLPVYLLVVIALYRKVLSEKDRENLAKILKTPLEVMAHLSAR